MAPNIVTSNANSTCPPHDFRLWVCLHEETHRVQFTAVPWLRDHLNSLIAELVAPPTWTGPRMAQMLRNGVQRIVEALRGDEEFSIIDLSSSRPSGRPSTRSPR